MSPDGLIAIVRAPRADPALLLAAARALSAGGVTWLEITLNTPAACAGIALIRAALPDVVCGAGTVLSPDDARAAIAAGAQFLVTPTACPATVTAVARFAVPVAMGCASPTEACAARAAGARWIKLFPAATFGLPHLRELVDQIPGLPLVPTGGVTPDNCAAFFALGCPAVAVGSALLPPATLASQDWPAITAAARRFTTAVRAARAHVEG